MTLSTAETNSVIHYVLVTNALTALTGNIPDANSPVYNTPLTISSTVQVRARAFPSSLGYLPGPVRNETYLQLSSDAARD